MSYFLLQSCYYDLFQIQNKPVTFDYLNFDKTLVNLLIFVLGYKNS